jgi:hypothetical protein
MAKGKAAKRGKKLTAKKRGVKDLSASKASGVRGGAIAREPNAVKLS